MMAAIGKAKSKSRNLITVFISSIKALKLQGWAVELSQCTNPVRSEVEEAVVVCALTTEPKSPNRAMIIKIDIKYFFIFYWLPTGNNKLNFESASLSASDTDRLPESTAFTMLLKILSVLVGDGSNQLLAYKAEL